MQFLAVLFFAKTFCSSSPHFISFEWNVSRIRAAFDGVERFVIGINEKPSSQALIEAYEGDTVQIVTHNFISESLCLHWHGILQIGTQEMDGLSGITQCPIPPGKTATYTFRVDIPGSYWWHGHEKAQYVDGLRGPLIVHPRQASNDMVEKEYVLQLTDWYHAESQLLVANFTNVELNPSGDKPVWDSVLINDRGRFSCADVDRAVYPNCEQDQPLHVFRVLFNKTYRLRLLNVAGFALFRFSIDEHLFQVIAADGVPTVPSKFLTSLDINIGQRYDVIVHANASACASYYIRATSLFGEPYTSLPLSEFPKGFNPSGLAILQYDPCESRDPMSQPWQQEITLDSDIDLVPEQIQSLPTIPDHRVVVEFTLGKLNNDPRVLGYTSIDNSSYNTFRIPEIPTLFQVAKGNRNYSETLNAYELRGNSHTEIVLLNNNSAEHPFHLHGHTPFVVASGNIGLDAKFRERPIPISRMNLENPIARDVYTLPPCSRDEITGKCSDYGYLVLRLIADNPGVWIMHCHIEWHLETGLAMLFVEDALQLAKSGLEAFDDDMLQLCSANDREEKAKGLRTISHLLP